MEHRFKHASRAPLGDSGSCFSFSTCRHLRSEREKKNRETFGRTRFLGVQAMIYIRFTVSRSRKHSISSFVFCSVIQVVGIFFSDIT